MIENVPLAAESGLSTLGLDAAAATGLEWLLSHHLGLRIEARYHFSYLPGGNEDFRVSFRGSLESRLPPWRYETGTLLAVQQVQHALSFSASAIAYW